MSNTKIPRGSKEVTGELKYLKTPCTIAEAVQIARGVAEDVMMEYQRASSTVQVSMSLQIEIMKSIIVKSGLATEDELYAMYLEKAAEFKKEQESYQEKLDEENSPKMDIHVDDIEVKKE